MTALSTSGNDGLTWVVGDTTGKKKGSNPHQ